MRWFLAGLGYTAHALARRLRTRGAEVIGCGRAPHLERWRDVGVQAYASDVSRLAETQLTCDVAVVLVPPSKPLGLVETQLAQRFVAAGCRQLIYVSSTGVYAPGGGAMVDETWPTTPDPRSAAGHARLAVEQALTSTFADITAALRGLPTPPILTIARVAGIYGPTRYPWDKVRDGTYKLIGQGDTAISRIHVEDLAAAIVALAQHRQAGVFNVADDDPASASALAQTVCSDLGLTLPTPVPTEEITPELRAMLTSDRHVDATKLKRATGWEPSYPSWRDAWVLARPSR